VREVLKREKKPTAPQPVGSVSELKIPGAGGEIPLKVFTPGGNGPFPVLVYYHGGGWVIGGPDVYESSARALVNAANCVVVMPAYRKAPEHKFPAAHDDCYATYRWVLDNAARVKGDPKRVAVGGESAGGNLAAATALRAKAEGAPLPRHQLLVYPITNHAFDTPSYKLYAGARPLNAGMMQWFFGHYFNSESDGADVNVSPLRASRAQLVDLPPATIVTAEIDPLRDDGKQYAQKLREADVDVAYRNYPGVTHEFFGMGAVVDEASDAVEFAAGRLRGAFARRLPQPGRTAVAANGL
jgi:acetyl esterase